MVKLWDNADVKNIVKPTNKHSFTVHAMATTSDGTLTVTGTNKGKHVGPEVKSWNPHTAENYATQEATLRVTSIAIQPERSEVTAKDIDDTEKEKDEDIEYIDPKQRYVAVREDGTSVFTLMPIEVLQQVSIFIIDLHAPII